MKNKELRYIHISKIKIIKKEKIEKKSPHLKKSDPLSLMVYIL